MEDHFLEVFILKFCTAWKNALLNNLRSPEKTTRMTMKTTTTVTTTTRSTTKKLKTRNWKTKKTSLKERRLRRIRARAARSRPFRDRRETISKKKMKTKMQGVEMTNFTYVSFFHAQCQCKDILEVNYFIRQVFAWRTHFSKTDLSKNIASSVKQEQIAKKITRWLGY